MAGAELPVQNTRQPGNIDPCRPLRAVRIDLLNVRHEHEVASSLVQHPLILRRRARVMGEILVRPELHRVHEDTGYETIAMAGSRLDETDVARMQIPHGGDERDTSPLTAPTAHVLANRNNLCDDIHRRS